MSVCAFLEVFVLVQKDPRDMLGDYGVGYFGVRDYRLHENQFIVKLEHGRLAMLSFVGFLVSDALTEGQPWPEQWYRLLSMMLQ